MKNLSKIKKCFRKPQRLFHTLESALLSAPAGGSHLLVSCTHDGVPDGSKVSDARLAGVAVRIGSYSLKTGE